MTTPQNAPAADEKEVRSLQSLRAMLAQSLAPRLKVDATAIADNKIVLEMAKGINAGDDLAALLGAIDAPTVTAGLAQIAKLQALKTKLDEILPKYEAAQTKIDEFETAEADQDVEMAMASQGWNPQNEALKKLLTKERKANKVEFRAQFNITDEALRRHEAERAHLSVSVATSRATSGTLAGPLGNLTLSNGRVVQGQGQTVPLSRDKPNTESIDVSGFPGANLHQKAEAYVRSLSAAPQKYDDVHIAAVSLVRDKRVYARNAA